MDMESAINLKIECDQRDPDMNDLEITGSSGQSSPMSSRSPSPQSTLSNACGKKNIGPLNANHRPGSLSSKTSFLVDDILNPTKFNGNTPADLASEKNTSAHSWQPWLIQEAFRRSTCLLPPDIHPNYRDYEDRFRDGKLIK